MGRKNKASRTQTGRYQPYARMLKQTGIYAIPVFLSLLLFVPHAFSQTILRTPFPPNRVLSSNQEADTSVTSRTGRLLRPSTVMSASQNAPAPATRPDPLGQNALETSFPQPVSPPAPLASENTATPFPITTERQSEENPSGLFRPTVTPPPNPANTSTATPSDLFIDTSFGDLEDPLRDPPDADIEQNPITNAREATEENTETLGSTFAPSILPRTGNNQRFRTPRLRVQNGAINRQTIEGRPVQERTRLTRVIVRPYDPLGMKIGSFILFSDVTARSRWTDNLLFSATDRLPDRQTLITPRFRLVSNWLNHATELLLTSNHGYYDTFDSQNEQSWQAVARGALDVTRRTRLLGEVSHTLTQESRTAPGRIVGLAGRTDITTTSVAGELQHRLNRLSFRLRGTTENIDYEEGSSGEDAAVVNGRDRQNREITLRTSYEFSPRLTTFVDGRIAQIEYQQETDISGIKRGVTSYMAAVGANIELTPLIRTELRMGHFQGDLKDSTLNDYKTYLFDANLVWTPTTLTTIRASIASDVAETSLASSIAAISRTYGLEIRHALYRNVNLQAAFRWQNETLVGSSQETDILTTTLEGEYLMNRKVALTANFLHLDYFSNLVNADYKVNEFTLGIRLQH